MLKCGVKKKEAMVQRGWDRRGTFAGNWKKKKTRQKNILGCMHCIAHSPRTLTPRQTRAHNKAEINKHARQTQITTIYNNKGSKQQQQAAMNEDDQYKKNTKNKETNPHPQSSACWILKKCGHKMDSTNSARAKPSPPFHSSRIKSMSSPAHLPYETLSLSFSLSFSAASLFIDFDLSTCHSLLYAPQQQRTGHA